MGNVIADLNKRWEKGVMPFGFNDSFPEELKKIVKAAIDHWNDPRKNMPVKLVPHKDEVNFVLFTTNPAIDLGGPTTHTANSSASQFTGMNGGMQLIFCVKPKGNIDKNTKAAIRGSLLHEIGHAFGLHHEQNRKDRNNHVKIHWENINPLEWSQFSQDSSGANDVGDYDYNSIMHYHDKAYSLNGKKTITTIPAGKKIGQRNGLSTGDIAAITFLYNQKIERKVIQPPAITIDPSPITINPPAITINPPAIIVDPPAFTVTPPRLTVHPPDLETRFGRFSVPSFVVDVPSLVVDPPPITINSPAIAVNPPPVTFDPPPVTVTPPPITL